MTTEEFMLAMAQQVPALASIYREHKSDYDEILPHVLMGDVARFALELVHGSRSGSPNAADTLPSLLKELERGMQLQDAAVQELIAVSFLENLDDNDRRTAFLAQSFGPALAREWAIRRAE